MSLQYSVRLYLPTEKIEQALFATIEIASKSDQWFNIRLPNNRKILVPGDKWNRERLHLQIGEEITLNTSLLFPVDEFVQAYIVASKKIGVNLKLTIVDGKDYCPIGRISLTLTARSKFTEFDFLASVSSFNEIFLKSNSAHQQFLKVLNAVDGVAGLIFVGTRRFHLLHDPEKTIYLNEDRYYLDGEYGDGVEKDIDRLTEAIKSKISDLKS